MMESKREQFLEAMRNNGILTPYTLSLQEVGTTVMVIGVVQLILPIIGPTGEEDKDFFSVVLKCDPDYPCCKDGYTIYLDLPTSSSLYAFIKDRCYAEFEGTKMSALGVFADKREIRDEVICRVNRITKMYDLHVENSGVSK